MSSRLLLADDHPLVLDGLARLFEVQKDFEIVAAVGNGREAFELATKARPDIAVLDINMPLGGGLEIAAQMYAQSLPTKVVLLTAVLEEHEVVEALRLGVKGIVLKESAPQLLLHAVREVLAGRQWLDRGIAGRTLETLLASKEGRQRATYELTPRELEIVRLVVRGMKNRDIGARLSIAEGTVKIHLNRVYQKLSVSNRVELTNFARSEHLV